MQLPSSLYLSDVTNEANNNINDCVEFVYTGKYVEHIIRSRNNYVIGSKGEDY